MYGKRAGKFVPRGRNQRTPERQIPSGKGHLMKIWAKLLTDGKIKKQFVYERDERLTYSRFFEYLSEISQALDIPTPVLLKTHIFNFAKFNHVKFVPRDFVESFDYDQLVLENIIL